jgi:hypothetical protein
VLVCIRVLNEKSLCIFPSDGCMCLRNIELESTRIHDCSGASNDMSTSKKVDCYYSSGKACYHNRVLL